MAAVKMAERATCAEIQATFVTCLIKLMMQEQQIYTLTSDNASDVIEAGKLMLGNVQPEDDESDSEDYSFRK